MYDELFLQHGLSIDRLKTLIEVCSTGSISRAADADPVRQSQYSRQLKELEAFFGVELTRRKGRGLEITPAGQHLARIAREQMQSLVDFKHSYSNQKTTFNIGAGDSLLHWLVIPSVSKLQKINLNVAVALHNLRSRQIVEGLLENKLDFGILREKRAQSPLRSKSIGDITYCMCIPKSLMSKVSKNFDKLCDLPIATQANEASFRNSLQELSKTQGVELNLRLLCESFPEAKEALLTMDYAAILPAVGVRDVSKKDFHVLQPEFLKPLKRRLELCWNPRAIDVRPGAEVLLKNLEHSLMALV